MDAVEVDVTMETFAAIVIAVTVVFLVILGIVMVPVLIGLIVLFLPSRRASGGVHSADPS